MYNVNIMYIYTMYTKYTMLYTLFIQNSQCFIHNLLMEHTMLYAQPESRMCCMALYFTFYWPIMNAWIIADFSLWLITMHTQCHRAQIYISALKCNFWMDVVSTCLPFHKRWVIKERRVRGLPHVQTSLSLLS